MIIVHHIISYMYQCLYMCLNRLIGLHRTVATGALRTFTHDPLYDHRMFPKLIASFAFPDVAARLPIIHDGKHNDLISSSSSSSSLSSSSYQPLEKTHGHPTIAAPPSSERFGTPAQSIEL